MVLPNFKLFLDFTIGVKTRWQTLHSPPVTDNAAAGCATTEALAPISTAFHQNITLSLLDQRLDQNLQQQHYTPVAIYL